MMTGVVIFLSLVAVFLVLSWAADSAITYARRRYLAEFGPRTLRQEVKESYWRR